MPRCHPRYFRCRRVIGGIGVVFVLDDDDDVDDDNSDGVSVGDGDVLAMMALLPTGRADSSGPWLGLWAESFVVCLSLSW